MATVRWKFICNPSLSTVFSRPY